MPLDVLLFRENPEIIRESQKKRFSDPALVDKVIALDQEWKKSRYALDQARGELKSLSKKIGLCFRTKGEERAKAMEEAKKLREESVPEVKENIARLSEKVEILLTERESTINLIGNLVGDGVPITHDESENEVKRKWGTFAMPNVKHVRHHHELLAMINGYDPERGVKVMGHRGYFLTGIGAQLNIALVHYGMDFLRALDYTPMTTPFFMRKDQMAKTAQLDDFDEQLYKVSGGAIDSYLIATSEQPISCFHANEWMKETELPLRYAGVSTCFRKEAGSHGRDVWGIFRVHQFDKIEQFVLCAPDESWKMHEVITKNAEHFLQSLNIPYRVVTIASGELNNAAAKKYDIECWFPAFMDFRELVSSSNCTDYQSRALEVRYGTKVGGEKEKKYVHMLNSTLCATTRAICAILENNQTDTGIVVPPVLRPYLGGRAFIEFVSPPPKMQAASSSSANKKSSKK
eukprot:CAMPEP_0201546120 /NCGR_PEP_ID=MMETSP0173_2-20130828/2505_1 /ASSEMBLY_ACC=CAM_ASM_000268 /TAXON_ID=218659 /ORGANISM="Vexillifera sp., Strain DIVA3 564/2" /LENGTH=460 /DNA_ID=CAMNT_0047954717 /DNA_START=66 /DNA_END=1448 /DNA_ORIENTATION=+